MTRSIRVLHLEDSPRDAEMIRHRLEVADVSWDIVLANSKDSFEAALTLEPFDLIISDYNLPGYDGVTALKQAQATQPNVPVILISGTVEVAGAVREQDPASRMARGDVPRAPAPCRSVAAAWVPATRRRRRTSGPRLGFPTLSSARPSARPAGHP
jgi:DNA-binding NtrC family response regulator